MSKWFYKVTGISGGDYAALADCLEFFDSEYEKAKFECKVEGNIERQASTLPQYTETRYTQLQEIEAILKFFNEQHKLKKGEELRKYTEAYARSLNPSTAEKYADSSPEVIDLAIVINQIAFVRNKFLSIMKAFEYKHYQITNITKLRCAGLDDAEISPMEK
jgi:hypothetical protein